MSEDIEYIANYVSNKLYVNPGAKGAYATIAVEGEELLGAIDVTSRFKLCVSAFFVNESRDFGTLKLTKLKFHARNGWHADGIIQLNGFQLSQISEFLNLIASLDLTDSKKVRVSLDNIQIGALGALLGSSKGSDLIQKLSESPELHQDIYAIAAKRDALAEFERKLADLDLSESDWQAFFERNPWIFGHGLNYVFLAKASKKLEARSTGDTFDRAGKRVDALMLTRAQVSQYVLVEIKRSGTEFVKSDSYRSGCWAVSSELSSAVTQTQKTAFEFARDRFRDDRKDETGKHTGEVVYAIEPKSFLVVGNLVQLEGHDDKISCFELYRKNTRSPEILTFDELFQERDAS